MKRNISKCLLPIAILMAAHLQLSAQTKVLTGFEGGSYYAMAADMKKILNVDLEIVSSSGNYSNFEKLKDLKETGINVVFLQFDVLFAGSYGFENIKKIQNIQTMLPLGKEDVHLVTYRDRNVHTLADLEGKKVGVGSIDQGTNITSLFIKKYSGIQWKDVNISFDKSIQAMNDGYIDAFFFVGSAPVKALSELKGDLADKIKLVPIVSPQLEEIYMPSRIKAGTYAWQPEVVETVSLGYVLATNVTDESDQDRDKLKGLITALKNGLEKLKAEGHPAWKDVDFVFDNPNIKLHSVTREVFGLGHE